MPTWYFKNGEKQFGPCSDLQLKGEVDAAKITPETMIRQGENGNWLLPPPTSSFTESPEISPKWYRRPLPVGLLIVSFFPVGLYLLWTHPNWKQQTKIIATCVFAVSAFIGGILDHHEKEIERRTNGSETKSSPPITQTDIKPNKKPSIPSLTATALMSEFARNRAIAYEKYLGETIDVSGSIAMVVSEYNGITLKSDRDPTAFVSCTFPEGWKAGTFHVGRFVKVRGLCVDYEVNSTISGLNMIHCEIVR